MNIRVPSFALAVGVFVAACCPEQFVPGSPLVSGSSSVAVENQKGYAGFISTLRGWERAWDGSLVDQEFFHSIVLVPQVELRGSGDSIEIACLSTKQSFKWLLKDSVSEPELAIVFARDRVQVGAQEFFVKNGNVFLVRLNGEWQAAVTQFPTRLESREPSDILALAKKSMAGDAEVQALVVRP